MLMWMLSSWVVVVFSRFPVKIRGWRENQRYLWDFSRFPNILLISEQYDTSNARAEAEDELISMGGSVLNLSGLWGGARHPKNWIDRVATTKEQLASKTSLHLIHGLDVARSIIAVHQNFAKAKGQRWVCFKSFLFLDHFADMRIRYWQIPWCTIGGPWYLVLWESLTERIKTIRRKARIWNGWVSWWMNRISRRCHDQWNNLGDVTMSGNFGPPLGSCLSREELLDLKQVSN